MRLRNYIFIFSALVLKMQAQYADGSPEEANPCGAIDNTLILNKKPMFAAYTREADVAWEKRVWREIDLREKINYPLYYPVDNQPCRISLIQLVSKHILKGDLIAFADENFYSPLTLSAVKAKLVEKEETVEIIYDSKGDPIEVPIVAYDSTSIFTKVIKVRFVEDWFLNKERSALEVKVIGIAFYEYVEEKEAYKELFWIYYPAAKKIFGEIQGIQSKEYQRSLNVR